MATDERHNAKLWVGAEKEQGEEPTMKLFVDGASVDDIQWGLNERPEVEEIYFAHGFKSHVVKEFVNKINVTLEVPKVGAVPSELKGRVNVVLRVPSYVTAFKTVDNGRVLYTETFDEITEWDGHKAYKEDEVLLTHE